jgi:hypothetical protein
MDEIKVEHLIEITSDVTNGDDGDADVVDDVVDCCDEYYYYVCGWVNPIPRGRKAYSTLGKNVLWVSWLHRIAPGRIKLHGIARGRIKLQGIARCCTIPPKAHQLPSNNSL